VYKERAAQRMQANHCILEQESALVNKQFGLLKGLKGFGYLEGSREGSKER
jgi:hypothetical protein